MCLLKLNLFRLDVSVRSRHTKFGKCEEVWLRQAAPRLPLHCLAAVTNNWPLVGGASRRRGDSAGRASVSTGREGRARPDRCVRAPVR